MARNHIQEHLLEDDEWEYWEGFNIDRSASVLPKEDSEHEDIPPITSDDTALPQPTTVPDTEPESTEKKPNGQVRMCRICFCSEDATEDQELFDQIGQEPPIDLGRLISPCKCKGSMKYVHLSCLNEWRKVTANTSAHFQCDQCKYEYSFERTKWATFLRNSLLILTLTTVSFITLVFWSGFIAKLILRFCFHQSVIELFSLSPDDLDDDLDQLVLQVLTEPTLFDLFKINWVHWVLGISLVGLVGAMHSVAGLGIYRMTRRRIGLDNERAGGGVLLATILIGSLKALWTVFCEVKKFSIRSLDILESRILDIGDDDDPIN